MRSLRPDRPGCPRTRRPCPSGVEVEEVHLLEVHVPVRLVGMVRGQLDEGDRVRVVCERGEDVHVDRVAGPGLERLELLDALVAAARPRPPRADPLHVLAPERVDVREVLRLERVLSPRLLGRAEHGQVPVVGDRSAAREGGCDLALARQAPELRHLAVLVQVEDERLFEVPAIEPGHGVDPVRVDLPHGSPAGRSPQPLDLVPAPGLAAGGRRPAPDHVVGEEVVAGTGLECPVNLWTSG